MAKFPVVSAREMQPQALRVSRETACECIDNWNRKEGTRISRFLVATSLYTRIPT